MNNDPKFKIFPNNTRKRSKVQKFNNQEWFKRNCFFLLTISTLSSIVLTLKLFMAAVKMWNLKSFFLENLLLYFLTR